MQPQPASSGTTYRPVGKLQDKVAIITGGDSGIGRAIAVLYAKEGADCVVVYLDEHDDAHETQRRVKEEGRECLALAGDLGDEPFAHNVVEQVVKKFGKLDILINNAAEQHPQESIENVSSQQLERTFRTNVFSMFYLTKAALPHLKEGSSIINTASITAYRSSPQLLDYSATKGAIVAYTRALSKALVERGIRVNSVAPGPIWTPLIPSTFQRMKWQNSARKRRCSVPDNPRKWRRPMSFWRRPTHRISAGSFFTPTVVKS